MHAASREALVRVYSTLDKLTESAAQAPAAAQLGVELFDVVEALDRERSLRVAVADISRTAAQRSGLLTELFGSRVAADTLTVLQAAASENWSTPREFRSGLVLLGRRALLRAAQAENQLAAVESQLFALSRILEREGELTMLLSDTTAGAAKHRELLAAVIYGKVFKYTEALALQIIGRPEHNPVDDMAALADEAAALRGRKVAHVVAATELTAAQQAKLEQKLSQIYGGAVSIHSEVDPALLGGMTVRVGGEKIDGSTLGRLERLRAQFA
ncbi:F0F1 ATP synthase subunit delta [Corynebacterium caspium]|uniref:F0F1 ATP synthase subunit delta n=1 Tax=Corynebacterium caspium TaxID=234828 RepID=UPI00038204A8|nr:F0F1 ATP synthase subunit delta [Corynebacterium caspium]WKD59449.1 ATP synthase subunit delta [Corynebacterium caspium DSM 44850]